MTKEFDDYHVYLRSEEQLALLSTSVREKLGLSSTGSVLDIVAVLRRAASVIPECKGLTIEGRPKEVMGRATAFAISRPPTPPKIYALPSILEAAAMGDPHARFDLSHELFHVLLHPGARKFRIATGNVTPSFIQQGHSAEWQANFAARAFLMPLKDVRLAQSASQLAADFGVPLDHAEARLNEVCAVKKVPEEVAKFLSEFRGTKKSPTPYSERVKRLEVERGNLWQQLSEIPGENPSEYRCARGWRVKRSEYLKMTECGWKIHNGEIRSYRDLQTS